MKPTDEQIEVLRDQRSLHPGKTIEHFRPDGSIIVEFSWGEEIRILPDGSIDYGEQYSFRQNKFLKFERRKKS